MQSRSFPPLSTSDDIDMFLGIPGLMQRLAPANISPRKALQSRHPHAHRDMDGSLLRIPRLEKTPAEELCWDPETARADVTPIIRGFASPTASGPVPGNRLVKIRGVPNTLPIGANTPGR